MAAAALPPDRIGTLGQGVGVHPIRVHLIAPNEMWLRVPMLTLRTPPFQQRRTEFLPRRGFDRCLIVPDQFVT